MLLFLVKKRPILKAMTTPLPRHRILSKKER
jgi:hypothetical protein